MANSKINSHSSAKNPLESLGIDVIPHAIGMSKFPTTPFQSVKFTEIESQVNNLYGDKIDDALSYSKQILDEENSRGDKIENKAYNILGVTGISAAFITGVTSLLPHNTVSIFFYSILILFFLIVCSLTVTVLLASKVVTVGEYKHTSPEISDIFKMGMQDLESAKKERLASYIYCYSKNFQVHNVKASYLIASQIWFRNTIILFLLLALIFAFSISQNPGGVVATLTVSPTVTPTSLIASPQYSSTVTLPSKQLLTITPTFGMPTKRPNLPTKPLLLNSPLP